MIIIRIMSLLLLIFGSLLLVSCLHDPTKSIVKNSRSDNLRTYQSLDNINYTVRATASLLEDDPAFPGNMLFAIQEIDSNGNLKFLALNGRILLEILINLDNEGNVITDTNGNPIPKYFYEDGIGGPPTDNEITGRKPLLNCSDIENEIDSPCMENVFLVGTLNVNWLKDDILQKAPVSGTDISVMKETWSLELTQTDENYVVTSTTPRLMSSTTIRYISQSDKEFNKGELFVHAYENKTDAAVNDWVSVLDANQINTIAKATSDPSPIKGSGTKENIIYDIYVGCDGASDINFCVKVASAEKNMTYQQNQENRELVNYGILRVQVIILSGRIDRATTAIGAVDLGYDVFSNCSPDLPGVVFERRYVSYTGSLAMYPDVGAVQFNFNCNAFYDFNYNNKPGTVVTSIQLNAELVSTSIGALVEP